ncbi:MAG TPA: ribosome small subunit-dependent GTPase A [Rhizomicrobium sp.]
MLERYGWSEELQRQFTTCADPGLLPARVIIQQRGLYVVVCALGEMSAGLSGRFMQDAADGDFPVAGDWVAVAARPNEGRATIKQLLPRSSVFRRRAAGPGAPRAQVVAANVDVALLLASLNADLSVRRLERYLAAAWEGNADPVIVLTKSDMCDDIEPLKAAIEAVAFGVPVHVISALTGEGLEPLARHLTVGKTAVLLGSSGVGKSTLVNALAGKTLMHTQAVVEGDSLGRHTTTHRELIMLPSGALILDTPGMRELGLYEADSGVSTAFADVETLAAACRFHDCRHGSEPGCAVQAALADGTLDRARWNSYGKLQREIAFEERKNDPRARAEARKVWLRRSKNYRAQKKFREREE